jgi:hypothetical protein
MSTHEQRVLSLLKAVVKLGASINFVVFVVVLVRYTAGWRKPASAPHLICSSRLCVQLMRSG